MGKLTSRTAPPGGPVETAPLVDSTEHRNDPTKLRQALERDGYLFVRDVVDPALLTGIREQMVAEVQRSQPANNADLIASGEARLDGYYDVLNGLGTQLLQPVRQLSALQNLVSSLFESPARAIEFVWARASGRGRAAHPHCDWVYLNRGSKQVLTAWIPVMDVPIDSGPLMVLEQSHKKNPYTARYLKIDADRLGVLKGLRWKHGKHVLGGNYSRSPAGVSKEFGRPWLSADFKAGDVILFGPRTLHATLTNQQALRLSIDVRFLPESEPMDPRFSGPSPKLHSERDNSIFDFLKQPRRFLGRALNKRSAMTRQQ